MSWLTALRRPLAWLAGALGGMLSSGTLLAHGHPAVVNPDNPDAWKYRLCAEMSSVAIQALHQRERGRPPTVYPDDGGPGPRIANAIVDKVYAEAAIDSPKRAEAVARVLCNDNVNER